MQHGLFPLKPLQAKALAMLRASIQSGHKRPILQASTGFGKTILAAHIVAGALAKGKRIAMTVPRLSLIDQTVERFIANGIDPSDIGVMQSDHPLSRPTAPVQVCSVQTIGRRGTPSVDFAIVDECHLRFDAIDDWLKSSPNIFIGLSATPFTKGLGLLYDDLLVPASMSELISQGYLCKFRAFAPSHVDLTSIKIRGGDYEEKALSNRMCETKLVADIVNTWCEKAEGRSTLLFAVDRAHADVLQRQFESVGVPAAYVDAFTPREARNAILRDLNRGSIKVICSVGTMTTGVDADVRCISFCRPTRSEILLVQALGRGLRTAPLKEDCLIFDHSDSLLRLGLPTDVVHSSLDCTKPGERRETEETEKERLPYECKECSFLIPASLSECPNCGAVKKKHSMVLCADGELTEIDSTEKGRRKANRELTWDEKTVFFAQLIGYADENNHKPGFAALKYRERFGVYPNDPRLRGIRPLYCEAKTRAWIKKSQRAWALRKHFKEQALMAASAREIQL